MMTLNGICQLSKGDRDDTRSLEKDVKKGTSRGGWHCRLVSELPQGGGWRSAEDELPKGGWRAN